jgi:periplasmic divalent cation tolerance protein
VTKYIVIYVTTCSKGEAEKIASILVKEGLAACVNIVPGVISNYIWEGKFCEEEEAMLVIKASARAFPKIEKRVRSIHSYKVPEIIAVPIIMGSRPYLSFLSGATQK